MAALAVLSLLAACDGNPLVSDEPETDDPTGAVKRFQEEGADIITFTSSSTVEHFLELGLPMPEGVKIASIGPITSQTLRDNGLNVDIEATRFDIPGLVEAIERYYR